MVFYPEIHRHILGLIWPMVRGSPRLLLHPHVHITLQCCVGFCCTTWISHKYIYFPPSWASLPSLSHTDTSLYPLILTPCLNCSPKENILLLLNLAVENTWRPLGPAHQHATYLSSALESCLVSRTDSFLLDIGDRVKRYLEGKMFVLYDLYTLRKRLQEWLLDFFFFAWETRWCLSIRREPWKRSRCRAVGWNHTVTLEHDVWNVQDKQ